MMKKLLSLLLTVVLLLTLGGCGKEEEPLLSPDDANVVAEKLVHAIRMRDNLSRFPLYLYDARGAWEAASIEAHGSAEAFFDEVQAQADKKGIDVTIDSFESYYTAYHQFILKDYDELYGKYTISCNATDSVKMTEDLLPEFRTNLLNGENGDLFDAQVLESITEVYCITVRFIVEGEKKDFSEDYLVYVVNYNGQWLVADHSA